MCDAPTVPELRQKRVPQNTAAGEAKSFGRFFNLVLHHDLLLAFGTEINRSKCFHPRSASEFTGVFWKRTRKFGNKLLKVCRKGLTGAVSNG
ncbi:hypothetical protein NPIL_207451 [Nephila pilipes]|uniref:Uncharacterized protein n=1 Tax=Nephila pilipes TaxID=299642 RepID=A0A8X6QVK5_NEPPI|nr:hypothetical protein NPIL_207451 [Nephila pilipes]